MLTNENFNKKEIWKIEKVKWMMGKAHFLFELTS